MAIEVILLLLAFTAPLNGYVQIDVVIPIPGELAKMARYVVHNSDWVSIATISTLPREISYPFANLKSVSDGPRNNGTGELYFYMSPFDLTARDVEKDNRCTVLVSLAQSDYCQRKDFDPQDPRCARVIISGHFIKVDPTTEEYTFAKNSLFERHPTMKYWPTGHNWYIAKVDIEYILVLDFFGGAKPVSKDDYFRANATPDLYFF